MRAFERTIEKIQESLNGMGTCEVRQLESSLSQLSPEHVAFAHDSLDRARTEERFPVYHLNVLGHFFEKWWVHSLATKLAAIEYVTNLSDSRPWPTGFPGGPAVNDILRHVSSGEGFSTARGMSRGARPMQKSRVGYEPVSTAPDSFPQAVDYASHRLRLTTTRVPRFPD